MRWERAPELQAQSYRDSHHCHQDTAIAGISVRSNWSDLGWAPNGTQRSSSDLEGFKHGSRYYKELPVGFLDNLGISTIIKSYAHC